MKMFVKINITKHAVILILCFFTKSHPNFEIDGFIGLHKTASKEQLLSKEVPSNGESLQLPRTVAPHCSLFKKIQCQLNYMNTLRRKETLEVIVII